MIWRSSYSCTCFGILQATLQRDVVDYHICVNICVNVYGIWLDKEKGPKHIIT